MGARVLGVTVLGVVVLAGVVSAPTVAQSCDSGSSEVTGAVVGAVSGGLLGAAIVSGDGQRVAIMVGAIAGGLLGHRFGASLDCDQQRYHSPTVREVLLARVAVREGLLSLCNAFLQCRRPGATAHRIAPGDAAAAK